MNRYDYYTRCVNIDEQEWLTEELYYPEQEDTLNYSRYESRFAQEYETEAYGVPLYTSYDEEAYGLEEEGWEEDAQGTNGSEAAAPFQAEGR